VTIVVKGGKGAAPTSLNRAQALLTAECTHVAITAESRPANHCVFCIAKVIDDAVRRALMAKGYVAPENKPWTTRS
jgi:hypothetical protein